MLFVSSSSDFDTNDRSDQVAMGSTITPEMAALSHEDKYPAILAILLIGSILSTAVVAMRLITRFLVIRTAGIDDYMIAIAQV